MKLMLTTYFVMVRNWGLFASLLSEPPACRCFLSCGGDDDDHFNCELINTQSDRTDGLLVVMADFHVQLNFMKLINKTLFQVPCAKHCNYNLKNVPSFDALTIKRKKDDTSRNHFWRDQSYFTGVSLGRVHVLTSYQCYLSADLGKENYLQHVSIQLTS